MFAFPVAHDVLASALDEMTRGFDTLLLRERGRIPLPELRTEQAEERSECALYPAVRRRGEQDQVAVFVFRDLADEFVTLVLAPVPFRGHGRPVRLVNNDELRAVQQKEVPVSFALHKVDARDLEGVVAIDAFRSGSAPVKLGSSARTNHDGVKPELPLHLLLPLIAEIRWA